MTTTINKKQIFDSTSFLTREAVYQQTAAQWVKEGSLAAKILSDGRMFSDKQRWVVTFALIENGKAEEYYAYVKMQAQDVINEERMERGHRYMNRNF